VQKVGRKDNECNDDKNDGNIMQVICENPNEVPLLFYKGLKKT
jgi:hypothetical protein